jgi:hypothetical protein
MDEEPATTNLHGGFTSNDEIFGDDQLVYNKPAPLLQPSRAIRYTTPLSATVDFFSSVST